MQVQIASKTLEITQALRQFTNDQAEKLLRFNQKIFKVRISLDQQAKGTKRDRNALVKYVVSIPGKTVVIKHKAHDMYDAIVESTDKVMRQLRKTKEKRLQKSR